MTENPVENTVCSTCGAPVRPQALFCYNCGSAVAPEIEKTERSGDESAREAWRQDEIIDENKAETRVTTNLNENHDQPIGKPTAALIIEDKPETKSAEPTETKLKSAAAIRRSGRTPPQRKTVEVVWDEPENAPNVWFLVAAFFLALFAVGILLAMLYIR